MATPKSKKTDKKDQDEKKETGTQVAKAGARSVAPAGIMGSLLQDQGAGHESMTSEDMALPFLYLLQDMSPQTKKRNEEFVEGAEPGMFYENIGRTLWDAQDGVLAVPCFFNSRVIEWVKREHGGGFVAMHPDKETALMECLDPEKNQLVDTHQHFLMIQRPDGTWTPALFPMTSTKLKASRRWNAAISQQSRVYEIEGKDVRINLPRFGCVWRLRSAETTNDKGDFFTTTTPECVEDVADRPDAEDLYRAAKAFYALCAAGDAKVDYTKYEKAEGEEGQEDGPKF